MNTYPEVLIGVRSELESRIYSLNKQQQHKKKKKNNGTKKQKPKRY
jgi:hypothetical protein